MKSTCPFSSQTTTKSKQKPKMQQLLKIIGKYNFYLYAHIHKYVGCSQGCVCAFVILEWNEGYMAGSVQRTSNS